MARPADAGARERILSTAGHLFYEQGVRATGMAEVVAAAGCGKNVLYRHFPSKSDLVAAYLDGFAKLRRAATAEALAGLDDDPAGAVVAMVAEIAARTETPQFRGCAFRNYLREFSDHDDELGRRARAWLDSNRADLRALAGRLDVDDPDGVADRVWLVLEGLYASAARGVPAEGGHPGPVAVALVRELVAARG